MFVENKKKKTGRHRLKIKQSNRQTDRHMNCRFLSVAEKLSGGERWESSPSEAQPGARLVGEACLPALVAHREEAAVLSSPHLQTAI